LPFVAHGIHREPGDWHDEDEAVAVLTAAIQSNRRRQSSSASISRGQSLI
jgi:hypothetical protein